MQSSFMTQKQKTLFYLAPFICLFLLRALIPNYISDDAYITLSTVKHFLEGHGFTFNPGEYVYVITNPLWAFGITLISWPGIDPAWALRILGWLCEGSLFLMMMALGHQMWESKNWGILWALLLFLNPVFLFSSFKGMETPLFLLVIIASIYFYEKKHFNLALIIAPIAIWIRFDGIILLAAISVLCIWKKQVNWQYWSFASLIIVAFFLFGELYYNEWLPNTVKSKTQLDKLTFNEWIGNFSIIGEGIIKYIGGFYRYSMPTIPVLSYPLICLGLFKKWYFKEKLPLLVWISLLYGIAILFSGRGYAINFPWYFCPIFPGVLTLVIEGIRLLNDHLFRQLRNPTIQAIKIISLTSFVVIGIIGLMANAYLYYKYHFPVREEAYAKFSYQLNSIFNTPIIVASDEIGAGRYILANKHYVFDLIGLSYPQKWRGNDNLIDKLKPAVLYERNDANLQARIDTEMPFHWYAIDHFEFALKQDLNNREAKYQQIAKDFDAYTIPHNQWYNKLYEYYHHFVEWIKQKTLASH